MLGTATTLGLLLAPREKQALSQATLENILDSNTFKNALIGSLIGVGGSLIPTAMSEDPDRDFLPNLGTGLLFGGLGGAAVGGLRDFKRWQASKNLEKYPPWMPVNPTPVNPTPVNPTPVNPTPADPTPAAKPFPGSHDKWRKSDSVEVDPGRPVIGGFFDRNTLDDVRTLDKETTHTPEEVARFFRRYFPEAQGEPKYKTLREVLTPYYKNAPGGLDRAVEIAQGFIPAKNQNKFNLVPWHPSYIDKKFPVYDATPSGLARFGTGVEGATADPVPQSRNDNAIILMNKLTSDPAYKDVLEHELSHAGLRPPGPSEGSDAWTKKHDATGSGELGLRYQDNPLTKHVPALQDAITGFDKEIYNYASSPEEFKAYMSPAKRRWVQRNRKHMTTKEQAREALDDFLDATGNQLPRELQLEIKRSPVLREAAIQQLLQTVQNNSPARRLGRAAAALI